MNNLVFLAIVTLTACASESPETPNEDPAAHACEHVNAAGQSIAASDSRTAAPALSVSDEPYTVMLREAAPGYVRVEGPLDALLFAKTANVVTGLFRGDDAANALPSSTPNEDCPTQIPEHFDLELRQAGPWYVALGPAAISEVWLMLTEAAGHGGH